MKDITVQEAQEILAVFNAKYPAAAKWRRDMIRRALQGPLSDAVCPSCLKSSMDHGRCRSCREHCGCSFDPTSRNDYCSAHRPR